MFILGINENAVSMEDRSLLKICYTGFNIGSASVTTDVNGTTISSTGDQILFMTQIVSGIDAVD